MTSKASVETFLSAKKIAVVGVSRSGKKFGSTIYHDLRNKGFTVYGINAGGGNVNGERLYTGFDALPESVDGAIFVVKPEQTDVMVKKAVEAGIKNIWLQQGAESDTAVQFCKNHNVNLVHGECILMFAEPVGFGHNIHRWIWKLIGKYPR